MNHKWLEYAQRLNAIAQNGLAFTKNHFEIERFKELKKIADEIVSDHTNLNEDDLKLMFSNEVGYTTPKVDVRSAVFQGDKILLVKEKEDMRWTLPGGFADVNDSPSYAAEREVLEESGFVVKARKLIAVYDRNKHPHSPFIFHLYKMFFLCDLISGEAKKSIETDGAEFFALDNLPEISIGRTTRGQIETCFKHYYNPQLPTEFD